MLKRAFYIVTIVCFAMYVATDVALAQKTQIRCKSFASDRFSVFSPLELDTGKGEKDKDKDKEKEKEKAKRKTDDDGKPVEEQKTSAKRIPLFDIKLLVDVGSVVDEGTHLLSYRLDREVVIRNAEEISAKLGEILSTYQGLNLQYDELMLFKKDYVMLQSEHKDDHFSKRASADISFDYSNRSQRYLASLEELHLLGEDLNVLNMRFKEYFRITKLDYSRLPTLGYLTAPYHSYVLYIDPSVRNGSSINTNEPIMLLGNLDPIRVVAFADQAVANKFQLGQAVHVTFDVIPGMVYDAKVVNLQAESLNQNTGLPSTFNVYLEINNKDLQIKDGMRGYVIVD